TPTTDPFFPTACAAGNAEAPVPQPTSRTFAPACNFRLATVRLPTRSQKLRGSSSKWSAAASYVAAAFSLAFFNGSSMPPPWLKQRSKPEKVYLFAKHVECPLLAQSGHFKTECQCPLLGVKRTLQAAAAMSAFDPKRTLPTAAVTPASPCAWVACRAVGRARGGVSPPTPRSSARGN